MRELSERFYSMVRELARDGELPAHVAAMELGPHVKLKDLGADSMAKAALQAALMDLTDKHIPGDSFEDETTLGDVLAYVTQSGGRDTGNAAEGN